MSYNILFKRLIILMSVLGVFIVNPVFSQSNTNLKGQNQLLPGVEKYQLIVKFSASSVLDIDKGKPLFKSDNQRSAENKLITGHTFRQVIDFTSSEKQMLQRGTVPPPQAGKFDHYAFRGLVYVDGAQNLDKNEVLALALEFEKLPHVEYAAISPLDPVRPPATPDFTSYQHYKFNQYAGQADVYGIDAEYAWSIGVTGQGVKIADIEWGMDFLHEDLNNPNFIEHVATTNHDYDDHGTAVAGIMYARNNGFGMTGMVHGADKFYGISEIAGGRVSGISKGLQVIGRGDVFVYEMQTGGQNNEYVPADYDQAVWDITKAATDAGIIVVAAAGNGNQNLDAAFYNSYRARGDNGAIRVGAGTKAGRNKASFSTYGSIVHLQGWGDWTVASTGYSDLYNGGAHANYNNSFSGTSSATPIVASAVVAVQSYAKKNGITLTPVEMRNLLIQTGTAQGSGGHIGPLPNIRRAIEAINIGPKPSTGVVTVYADINYGGFSGGLSTGDYTLAQLNALGVIDNDITSVKVSEGYKVILFFDNNFTGKQVTYTNDMNWVGEFNDQVTSIRVLPNGNPNLAGTYFIKNSVSNWFVDLANADPANGTQIRQWDYNGSDAQKFRLEHLGDGNYRVVCVTSNKVWDIDGVSQGDGAVVHEWENANGKNQHFILVDAGNGLFKMIAEHSGKVAEVSTNNHGEQLHQWANAGQANSKWLFVPTDQVIGAGTGLRANYFNGQNFETPVFTRLDPKIDFDWANGSPDAAVNNDSFTARWTGQVQAQSTAEYTFYMQADNGRRLWVNNQLIIDNWLDDVSENSGKITLTGGQKYDIKIEYFENNGGAEAHLSWSTLVSGKALVPATQLYANTLPTASIATPTNNQTVTLPSAVNITANTADTDGSIAKVEFYNGTVKLGEKTASPFTYNWTNAAKGTYTLTVRSYDNRGAVVISVPITVVVNDPVVTDVSDVQTASGFTIYPNPVEGTLYVNSSEDLSGALISIFDAQGKLVSTPALHAEAVYVGNLQAGFYIIEIANQNSRQIQRFIKK